MSADTRLSSSGRGDRAVHQVRARLVHRPNRHRPACQQARDAGAAAAGRRGRRRVLERDRHEFDQAADAIGWRAAVQDGRLDDDAAQSRLVALAQHVVVAQDISQPAPFHHAAKRAGRRLIGLADGQAGLCRAHPLRLFCEGDETACLHDIRRNAVERRRHAFGLGQRAGRHFLLDGNDHGQFRRDLAVAYLVPDADRVDVWHAHHQAQAGVLDLADGGDALGVIGGFWSCV